MEYIFLDKETFLKNPNYWEDIILEFHKNNGCYYKKEDFHLKQAIEEWGTNYVIALENNKIVCLARYALVYGRKTIYMLRQIDTLKEWQGKGIATNAILFAHKNFEKTKATKLIAAVDSGNIASIKLHKKCGYEEKQPPLYIKNDKNRFWQGALYFEKTIEKNYEL